jgi:hypothetical protein
MSYQAIPAISYQSCTVARDDSEAPLLIVVALGRRREDRIQSRADDAPDKSRVSMSRECHKNPRVAGGESGVNAHRRVTLSVSLTAE